MTDGLALQSEVDGLRELVRWLIHQGGMTVTMAGASSWSWVSCDEHFDATLPSELEGVMNRALHQDLTP